MRRLVHPPRRSSPLAVALGCAGLLALTACAGDPLEAPGGDIFSDPSADAAPGDADSVSVLLGCIRCQPRVWCMNTTRAAWLAHAAQSPGGNRGADAQSESSH